MDIELLVSVVGNIMQNFTLRETVVYPRWTGSDGVLHILGEIVQDEIESARYGSLAVETQYVIGSVEGRKIEAQKEDEFILEWYAA
jgi:hypothetical protein